MNANHMAAEIREQPRVLAATAGVLEAAREAAPPAGEAVRSLYLAGCGDMAFAAEGAAWFARRDRVPVFAHPSMEFRFFQDRPGAGDLLVAASISGRTPRTVEAVCSAARRGAATWGISSCRDTRFAKAVDRLFLLPTGPEEELSRHPYAGYHHNVPQTKSFAAAVFAELCLLRALGLLDPDAARSLADLPARLAGVLPSLEKSLAPFCGLPPGKVERVAVLGSGPWRPLAAYGAAKLLEMAVPARSQCLEENNHLELFVTGPAELQVFLAPDEPSWTRAEEMLLPYGRLDTARVVLAPPSLAGGRPSKTSKGVWFFPLPEEKGITAWFCTMAWVQLFTLSLGTALGRDVDRWVGGVRTDLIESLGQELVRGSRIRASSGPEG